MLDLSDPSHQGLCVAVLVLVISAYLFFAREAPTVYGERPKDALKNVKQRQVEQPSPKTKRAKAARVPKSASSSSAALPDMPLPSAPPSGAARAPAIEEAAAVEDTEDESDVAVEDAVVVAEDDTTMASMPQAPQAGPLKTVREVLDWAPTPGDQYNVASTPLQFVTDRNEEALLSQSNESIAGTGLSRPNLLVCHDMRGGYQEDRFVQGTASPESLKRAFRLYHWPLIDTFVYFAHELVTVPPATWVNCAHANGTRVLGTVITEHEEGRRQVRLESLTPSFSPRPPKRHITH
jgi:hypothetical protein